MKVAFATYAFPPEGSNGGLATFYFELSRALVLLGHEVLVVTLSQHEDKSEIIDGVRVERIHFDESSTTNLANLAVLPSLSWFVPRMLQLQRKAAPLIDEFTPDVIECAEHGFLRLLDASNRKSPLVVRCLCPAVHAIAVNADAKTTVVDLNLLLAMEASLVRAADALTTPSANLAAIVAGYTGVPASEFRIIKNPLASVGEIQRDAAIEKHSTVCDSAQETDFPRMTFIGRVENLKGCDLLIEMLPEVLAKYPKARLTMIGQDAPIIGETYTLSDRLRERLKQLGCLERVRFTGAIPRHQIRHYLDETDFCIFPSRYDSSPFACLETMSYGIPVIATKVGGIPEYVEDGVSGMLVASESPAALAKAAIAMADDESLRMRLGRAGRESTLRDLDPAKIASETVELYDEAIHRYAANQNYLRRRSGPDPILKSIIDAYDDFAANDYIGQARQVLLDQAYVNGFEDGIKQGRIQQGFGARSKARMFLRSVRRIAMKPFASRHS